MGTNGIAVNTTSDSSNVTTSTTSASITSNASTTQTSIVATTTLVATPSTTPVVVSNETNDSVQEDSTDDPNATPATTAIPVITVTTATSHAVDAGETTIRLADVSGLEAGMSLTISNGSISETRIIVNISVSRRLSNLRRLAAGSVIVDSPLEFSFAAGAIVTARPQAPPPTPVPTGLVQDTSSGDDDSDTLIIVIIIVAAVVVLGLLTVLLYWLIDRRNIKVETHQQAIVKLEECVSEHEASMLQLCEQIEAYTAKFAKRKEGSIALSSEVLEHHQDFIGKWMQLSKDNDAFLQDYTRHLELRKPVQTEQAATDNAKSSRPKGKACGGCCDSVWAPAPVTSMDEVRRQSERQEELGKRRQHVRTDFAQLSGKVLNEPNVVLVRQPNQTSRGSRLEDEIEILRSFVHPLLLRAEVKPYGVLGVSERQSDPEPLSKLDAVLVDPAGWPFIGERNNPGGAGAASRSIYEWLGLRRGGSFPVAVHNHFKTNYETDAETRAIYNCYGDGQHVIHTIGPKVRELMDAVNVLSQTYCNVLTEFCRAISVNAGNGKAAGTCPTTLRLIPISSGVFLLNRQLERHMPQITWSALSVACVMLPPALQEQLQNATIELCIFMKREVPSYERVLNEKKEQVSGLPMFTETLGQLTPKSGGFDWIRTKNGSTDRLERLAALLRSAQAIWNMGYGIPGGQQGGQLVKLLSTSEMLKETRTYRAQTVTASASFPAGRAIDNLEVTWDDEAVTVMEAAARSSSSGLKTVAVNAASAYSVGGGVLSGGRHALEESWCITSTLLQSLLHARWQHLQTSNKGSMTSSTSSGNDPAPQQYGAQQKAGREDSNTPLVQNSVAPPAGAASSTDDSGCARGQHIPVDGCIVSPGVQIFRDASTMGYAFQPSPVSLAGVCSIAMFNMNPRVKDSPLDAPSEFNEYCKVVRQKFRSVVLAAVELNAEALICPDVGCGVFENDPHIVGTLLGEVLCNEPAKSLKKVVVVGKAAFFEAAKAAAAGKNITLQAPPGFSSKRPSSAQTPLMTPTQSHASQRTAASDGTNAMMFVTSTAVVSDDPYA